MPISELAKHSTRMTLRAKNAPGRSEIERPIPKLKQGPESLCATRRRDPHSVAALMELYKDVTIGKPSAIANDTDTAVPFVGVLAEGAIYDKILPPARILAHYQAGIGQ